MTTIRDYRESDSITVGCLIADTYGEFNLAFATPEERDKLLGPFAFARSLEATHQEAIAQALRSAIGYVAEKNGNIVGVLRGRLGRIASLFVGGDFHRRGIGRRLVGRFEDKCLRQGGSVVKVASTLYAVPFYTKLGYKKTTGVRAGWSFEGTGLIYQPMKKVL